MDVILVDEHDVQTGTMEKMEVHQKALLHRAFSIFIFNEKGEMLLHKRADKKYHSGGLWTNACCSHPAPGETTLAAAKKRLQEEMGFDTKLEFVTSFIYKAELDQHLIEHEFDHVFIGEYSDIPSINKTEVAAWKFVDLSDIDTDLLQNPEKYTVWFRIIFARVKEHFLNTQK